MRCCQRGWSAGGAGCLSATAHQTIRSSVSAKTIRPSVMWAMRIGACCAGGATLATTNPAAKARITASALVQWMAIATLP